MADDEVVDTSVHWRGSSAKIVEPKTTPRLGKGSNLGCLERGNHWHHRSLGYLGQGSSTLRFEVPDQHRPSRIAARANWVSVTGEGAQLPELRHVESVRVGALALLFGKNVLRL